jgi:predicted RNA binding protein YcfA (HicA-like mRNA interferase family)
MKRKELIKELASAGCIFVRYSSLHDLYINPKTGKRQPVPRHDEIEIDETFMPASRHKEERKYITLP